MPAAVLLLAAAAGAQAQSARTLSVVPTFSATMTATDNRALDASRQADLVTEVSPGVRILGTSGPVQGSLDYQLNGTFYARRSERNETRNTFSAALLVRPLDDRLSITARAGLARQSISAFGTQTAGTTIESSNTTEVANLSIAPALHGTLGGAVDYDLRVSRDFSRAKGTDAGDSNATSANVHLGGRLGRLGWGLDATRQRVAYRQQPSTTDDRAFASLIYSPDYDLTLTARGGAERGDSLGLGFDRTKTYGASINWTPSPRTTFSLDADHRYFGHSHALSMQHRMARSYFTYTDSRNINSSSSTRPGLTGLELFSGLIPRQNGESEVDYDARIRSALALIGIDPGAIVTQGFLTSSRSVSRSRQLAWVYNGQRTTFTVSGFGTSTERLIADELLGTFNDPPITQFGYSLSVSHRLSQRDGVSLNYVRNRTPDSGVLLGNDLRIVNVLWTLQPGLRTTISLGGRHVEFDGPLSYNENTITATLGLRF